MEIFKNTELYRLILPNSQIKLPLEKSKFYQIIMKLAFENGRLDAKGLQTTFGFTKDFSNSLITKLEELGLIRTDGSPANGQTGELLYTEKLADLRIICTFDPHIIFGHQFYQIGDESEALASEHLEIINEMKKYSGMNNMVIKTGNTGMIIKKIPAILVLEYLNTKISDQISVRFDGRIRYQEIDEGHVVLSNQLRQLEKQLSDNIEHIISNYLRNRFDNIRAEFTNNSDMETTNELKIDLDEAEWKIQQEFMDYLINEGVQDDPGNYSIPIQLANGWYFHSSIEIVAKGEYVSHLLLANHLINGDTGQTLIESDTLRDDLDDIITKNLDTDNIAFNRDLLFDILWNFPVDIAKSRFLAGVLIEEEYL